MKKEALIILTLLVIKYSVTLYNNGENWAILACGSKGYTNYRHQADVFHVYQSLIKRGFSKNHIILFAYDDIAYNPRNPFPGEIYNRPDGPNVYEGVIIDYSYNNVNPETYLSVLKGDNQNGKLTKVLNSTENDNIFLFFSDHGIAGAIVFPDSNFLYADELEETFKIMKAKKMYKNIIFYLEACYSGSMFYDINPDLNVYSITAANPNEQSLATYCYPQNFVKGEEMHTCLSNEFTSNWLDDSDSRIIINEDINNDHMDDFYKYSSHDQFVFVKDLTKNSHVQEYGNLSIGDLPITHFQSSNYTFNNKEEDAKEKEEETAEEEEYEEIKRRIIDFDFEEENDDYLYSNEKIGNDFENLEFDNISLINYDKSDQKKAQYNYIAYMINRNKYFKKEESKKEKIIKNKVEDDDILRGKKTTEKKFKIVKNTEFNLLSSDVKLFYLELDIEQSKDLKKYLDFQKEMKEIKKTQKLFGLLRSKLNSSSKMEINQKIDYKCLRYLIKLYKNECGIDERDLEYISFFSYECSKKDIDISIIKEYIVKLCKDKKEGILL